MAVVDIGDDLPLTVPALLNHQVSRKPNKPFLICDDDELSYWEADIQSSRLAKGLIAHGVGPNTRVGLLFPNGSAFVVAWLAAARIGAVTLPISTFSTAAELSLLLRGADVEVLLSAPAFRGRDYAATV